MRTMLYNVNLILHSKHVREVFFMSEQDRFYSFIMYEGGYSFETSLITNYFLLTTIK